MKRKHLALIATASAFALFGGGVFTAQTFMTSRIESRVKDELPKASGVSASIPLLDVPSNLVSDSIKSANININGFTLKENGTKTSLNISATNISKSKPTLVGSLELTATIPVSTIAKASEFGDAQIVGNTLQVAAGAGGMGKAILLPRIRAIDAVGIGFLLVRPLVLAPDKILHEVFERFDLGGIGKGDIFLGEQ